MGTRGFDRGSGLQDRRLRCHHLIKQVAKNKCRTSNGCSLTKQVAIQPDPAPTGWDWVPQSWGAIAPTPVRAMKDLSAGPV